MKQTILIASLALLGVGCSNFDYEKHANSVVVKQGEIVTEITVMNDEIMRVNKSYADAPERKIPEYVVEIEPQGVEWRLSESGGNLIVESGAIRAKMNEQGEISFETKEGKSLTSEVGSNTYINKVGDGDYAVAQAFASGDEALYGLGQYQNGLINWKSTPVTLMQWNQEIAVPFVVSTAGYGIYWGNYGITQFNYPENEIALPEVVNEERKIRRGKFTPQKSGVYNFLVDSPTPLKNNRRLCAINLLIDQDTVVSYTTMWAPDSFAGRKELKAGTEYTVTLEDWGAQVDDAKVLYNEPDHSMTTFSSDHGESLDYYIICGENPAKILNSYGVLTGKAPLLPLSSYGFWHCREAYRTQAELLKNAHEYRRRQIPVDNIVQDWDYWPKGTRCPEWSRDRYPDPKGMVDELSRLNMNLLVSVWPGVNSKSHVERYNLKKIDNGSYINAYDDEVCDNFYKMLSDSMYKIGVRSIWIDGSEPATVPPAESETGVGNFEKVTSIYSQRVTGGVYEGHRKEFPDKRVVNLTRSGFSGQQRYGTIVWSGDIDGTWKQYREQIPAGLNTTMAGLPYWTTDIGGFFRNMTHSNTIDQDQYRDPNYLELLTRWFEYGTFCPIFRIHGFKSQTEVWRYGKQFERIARKYIDLRYQLMPYIYSEARKVTTDGAPIMSPLAYQYPEDKNLWNIDDQYLFGESMMIAPVTEYKAREREVYLPEGVWHNFWNGAKIKGGRSITASAPIDEMPIFVKGGSIIPFGAKVQYAEEPNDEPMLLKIYSGGDATYRLYIDDYNSYGYEDGEYSEIIVAYNEFKKIVVIKAAEGSHIDFKSNPRKFVIEMAGVKGRSGVHTFNGDKLVISCAR